MKPLKPQVVRMNVLQIIIYGWWFYPLRDWFRYMAGPPKN